MEVRVLLDAPNIMNRKIQDEIDLDRGTTIPGDHFKIGDPQIEAERYFEWLKRKEAETTDNPEDVDSNE